MRDEGRFLSGRPLAQPPELFIGAAENPFAPPYEFRPLRLAKKIAAGAQFIQTQYCYDLPLLERFMARVRELGPARALLRPGRRRPARLGAGRALDPRARAGRAHPGRGDRADRAGREPARGRQARLHRADPADPRDRGRRRDPPDGLPPGGVGRRDHRALGRAARPPAAQRDRPLGGLPAPPGGGTSRRPSSARRCYWVVSSSSGVWSVVLPVSSSIFSSVFSAPPDTASPAA